MEATVDLGEFAFKLSPTYALVDPEGYVEHVVGLGQGVAYGVTHPVELGHRPGYEHRKHVSSAQERGIRALRDEAWGRGRPDSRP